MSCCSKRSALELLRFMYGENVGVGVGVRVRERRGQWRDPALRSTAGEEKGGGRTETRVRYLMILSTVL